MKILLLDNESDQGKRLRFHLQQLGHQVLLAADVDDFSELVKRESPDLVLVDECKIEIDGARPLGSGEGIAKSPFVLPLSCSQLSGDGDSEGNLAQQTAEQIAKRIRSLRRRDATRVRVGDVHIRFDRKQVSYCGQPLRLTPLQFKLLGVLALNARQVVSHRELLEQVWGYSGDEEEARELAKAHINRIRQKMRAVAPGVELPIHSVRGFGYMLLNIKS
jgi:DNA-binding response OmpR family regulator